MQIDQLTDLVMDLLDRTDDPIRPEARWVEAASAPRWPASIHHGRPFA